MKGSLHILCVLVLLTCSNKAFSQHVHGGGEAPGGSPMTCFIEAKVISTLSARVKHTVANPSYKVKVKLLSVSHCGSSVPMALNPGDIVEITVASSDRLRKGDTFKANAEERLRMGHQPQLLVFSYGLNKRR